MNIEATAAQKSLYDPELAGLPVRIMIDNGNPASIPASVLVGTGDKKARYKKWLDKAFTDDTKLLRYLAFIYKTIKEHSKVELICTCKSHKPGPHFHTAAIYEWLDENHETLDTLLPYLFDKAEQAAGESVTQEQQEIPMPMSSATTADQAIAQGLLSADDFAQMTAIINADQTNKE